MVQFLILLQWCTSVFQTLWYHRWGRLQVQQSTLWTTSHCCLPVVRDKTRETREGSETILFKSGVKKWVIYHHQNIIKVLSKITKALSLDIHPSQNMNPVIFGDHLICKISTCTQKISSSKEPTAMKLTEHLQAPQRMNSFHFGYCMSSILASPSGQNIIFLIYFLQNVTVM